MGLEISLVLEPLEDEVLSSPTADNPPESSAVHEVAATLASPIDQVSCGSGWSCLLCDDGRAYSFGDNTYGQLGQSHDRPYVAAPVPLSTPSHGGFVLDVGEIYMFGCGSYGRLGTGNEDNTCKLGQLEHYTKTKTGIISFGDGMNGRLGLGDEKDRLEGALLSTWLRVERP
ncbi:Regulator of chromosome condensation 1/beta-lactamase-inhibitor protein II [Phytophthora cactorum]|nr:Regulator of chromosome condensation 1/beta-lactamase-inhibitor protein II [Phytophthora cactorum]